MFQWLRRKWWVAALVALAIAGGGVYFLDRWKTAGRHRQPVPPKAEAPPDLQKLRDVYAAGVEALRRDDGPEAVRHLSSFTFGSRAVEEYRLYYLANAQQLAGNKAAARATLATLWRRSPRLLYADDAAFNLASFYSGAGDWEEAADVYAAMGRRADNPAVAASARWNAATARLHAGDISGAAYIARTIALQQPRASEAGEAIALVRSALGLGQDAPLPLTPSERLDRARALLAQGAPQNALDELTALEPVAPQLRSAIQVQRGIALNQLRRLEDSNKVLEPHTSGPFKYAIPALRYAAKNYAMLAASIDPTVTKTVKERKRVGTTKVRVGKGKKRRTVTKPRYQTITRTVKLVDLAKQKNKEENERLASERFKDLLLLPLDPDTRLETLNALIVRAQAKSQDDYLQELVTEVIRLDPSADPALQHFWDKGWGAYTRGDLATARTTFRFIAGTYGHPNVRRQSQYWYARTAERQGEKEEAAAIYRQLASAPYADLYAHHAVTRGAKRGENESNPLEKKGPDWGEISEKEMPDELELAYELTALSAMREAYNEVRRNMRRGNTRFAEALLADVHYAAGNKLLMYLSLRKAWPQLATVEQDTVPAYFLRMYYPLQYSEEIETHSKKNGLDPNLVRALILQESYYNPQARSRVGATGLMQLMPPTAKEHAGSLGIVFAASRLENPDVNIQLGTFHLRMLLNLFRGNQSLAIASYNAGQGNVLKWQRAARNRPLDELLESIPFPETRNYVKRVTMLKGAYERIGV